MTDVEAISKLVIFFGDGADELDRIENVLKQQGLTEYAEIARSYKESFVLMLGKFAELAK